jgi:hypothetical protein
VPALRKRGRETQRLLSEVAHGAKWAERVERYYKWCAEQPLRSRQHKPHWLNDTRALLPMV